MHKPSRLFAHTLLLLGVLLSACQIVAAPVPVPVVAIRTPTPRFTPELASALLTSPTPTATAFAPIKSPSATSALPTSTPVPTSADTATPIPMVYVPAGRVVVPILMYHRIRDDGATRYITPIKSFREQMQALKDAGYHSVTVEQLAKAISQGADLPINPIVLTFDDGYLDVYQNALPIMKEMGFIGTAYIITITFEKEKAYGYMQPPELKALAAAGWEIGSHSITHTDLKKSTEGIGNEIQKSRDTLEEKVGVKVHTFSYPYGTTNPWIEDLVKKMGYDAAVGIGTTITHTPKRLYYLSRREVYRGITLQQFHDLLQPGEADTYVGTPVATPTP